jgi:hypothetical protein
MIAALYVETDGCYSNLAGVDPWDIVRDARRYTGPYPVVAHPDCKRWGRFFHGSTRKPHQFRLGEDGGCFAAALTTVRNYGGVLEHPADSRAWKFFGMRTPARGKGWTKSDDFGGMSCYVDQAHYGHFARKPTWLYAVSAILPELVWTPHPQIIPDWMIERYGYEKARKIGQVAMIGGKDKTKIRNATPPAFRDLLLSIARSVSSRAEAA